jgi:hypothetical protein
MVGYFFFVFCKSNINRNLTALIARQNSPSVNLTSEQPTFHSLLKFDYKKMDADRELLSIINNAVKGGAKGGAKIKSAASLGQSSGGGGARRKDLQGGRIVKADTQHWELFDMGGLSMDIVSEGPPREFVYRHSKTYQHLQNHFWRVAESSDSNALFVGCPVCH